MSTHSPLPWASRGGEIVAADGVVVARVDGPNRVDLIPTRDANRALLAAAPELLEALQYIMEWDAGLWDPQKARSMARAAIAKAKGT